MSAIDIQLQPTLKLLREKHGLTQEASARLVRVTPRSWARYESGDRVPAEGVLELFCIKLGEEYPQAFAIQLYNMHLAEGSK